MKARQAISLFVFILLAFNISFAQEEQKEITPDMKAWMEYMTPSEVHEMMAQYVGEWKGDITMWQYPGAEPMVSVGSSVNEMLLGGRYLRSSHKGEFMGMEMNGMSLESYDNGKEEFTTVWIDNFGTGMMIGKGKWDAATKSINYEGMMYDPMQGFDVGFREVMTYIDKDNQKLEMFMKTPEGEFKSMEIIFTRVK